MKTIYQALNPGTGLYSTHDTIEDVIKASAQIYSEFALAHGYDMDYFLEHTHGTPVIAVMVDTDGSFIHGAIKIDSDIIERIKNFTP